MASSELRLDISALDRASATFVALGRTVEKLEKKLEQLDKQDVDVDINVDTSKAERNVGAFAADMRKRLAAAVKALPEIELDADASDADRKVQFIRKQLKELSDLEVGVDIDAADAEARLRLLQSELKDISDSSTNIQLKADASKAVAALGQVRDEIGGAERDAGSFANYLQTHVARAIQSLPDIEITAESSDADREIARIRGELEALSNKRIGVDIDAGAASAELTRLRTQLDDLGRSSADVRVQADTAAASAQLAQVEREISSLNGRTATARVDVDASAALSALTRLGQVMGGLALGGGVLAAVPQLASLAGAAVAAAGALGAIPAAIGAGGAAFGAVKIGLTGLSDAFSALGETQTSAASSAGSNAAAQEAAARQIASAQQALADAKVAADRQRITSNEQVRAAEQAVADAVEQADQRAIESAARVSAARAAVGEAIEASARRVESAEAALERSQVSARDAQEALNRAREDAKERIEDLTLALSGAALDEESAQVRLERAQERLAKLSRTGGSALDFREASLGVRQAQQALLEVRERYGDVKAEAADANAKGVEGAENVVAAQRRLDDSNKAVAASQRDLDRTRADGDKQVAAARARLDEAIAAQRRSEEESDKAIARSKENLARVERQAAWQREDANKAVTRAQAALNQAIADSAKSAAASAGPVSKFNEALGKLAPNARAFVETIKELKPRWDELTKAVQNRLFEGVAEQTARLADQYLPRLQGLFVSIAGSANRAALDVAGFFAQDATAETMQVAFDRIGKAIDIAAQAARPLAEVLTTVFSIGTEFLGPMAEKFKQLADRMAEFTRSAEGQNKIREWISEGIETLTQFGELLWNVGAIFYEVFSAADAQGVDFLGTLVGLTDRLKEFLQSAEGQDTLRTVFAGIRETIDALKPGLQAVGAALVEVIREIAPKLPGVAESFSRLAEKLAPILADITVAVFEALAFAFDVLSRLPAPVLVALAAAFVAIAGLAKVGGAIKSTVEMFDALGKAHGHVSSIADKLRDIFRQTGNRKGALKAALLGDDGCTSTRACLDEVGDKLDKTNRELDKTKKKGGLKGALLGVGAAVGPAAGLAGGVLAADAVLPEQVGGAPGNYGQQSRDDLKGWADALKGLFTEPFAEIGRQWDDFWGELQSVPAGFDQSPFMQFWRGIPNWWRDEVWGPLSTGASEKWAAFTGWWDGITADFSAGWNGFWDGLGGKVSGVWASITTWASEKWAGFTTWWDETKTGFTEGWNGFWDGLGTKVSGIWDSITGWVSEKWTGFTTWMSEQWAGFTEGWNEFWDGVGGWAATTWDNIKTWVSERWTALTTWLGQEWEILKARWNKLWDDVGDYVSLKWDNIKLWISTKWTEMTSWLSARWQEFQAGWNGMWSTVGRFFSDRWEDIKRIASGAWTWIRTTVWDPMVRFVTTDIPNAFSRAVQGIQGAWDRIQEITARPVRFVVNTVYNGAIRPAWNAVASVVSLPPMPEVRFHSGGIVPGPTNPYRDNRIAAVNGGEAVMRPEWTRAVGADKVNQWNAAARAGGPSAVLKAMNTGQVVEGADHNGPGSSTVGFGGVRPHVAQAGHYLKRRFGIGVVGGVGSRPNASDHPKGLALDFMTWGENGTQLANYVMGNRQHFGVTYAIWRQKINSGSGWRPMANRGSPTANHMDHVHVSFVGPGGTVPAATGGGFIDVAQMIRDAWGKVTGALSGAAQFGGTQWGRGITGAGSKMASAALDKLLSKATFGLFDRGGYLMPGSLATNLTGSPERVLSPSNTASFDRLVASLDTRGRVRGSDGGSLLDLDPVVGQLRALRGDVDQGGHFGSLIAEVRELRRELARTGGSAAASAQAARTAAELGAF